MLWDYYLSLSSGDLTNTSPHTCGSWHLPIFLFGDGSLTVISIASLIDLAILWSTLPTMLIFSRERSWPVVLWWSWMGEGTIMCSLNLFTKVLPDSSIYSSSHLVKACALPIFYSVYWESWHCVTCRRTVFPIMTFLSALETCNSW